MVGTSNQSVPVAWPLTSSRYQTSLDFPSLVEEEAKDRFLFV